MGSSDELDDRELDILGEIKFMSGNIPIHLDKSIHYCPQLQTRTHPSSKSKMRLPPSLYVLLATSIRVSCAQETSQAPLAGDDDVCEDPPYRVHMVSQSPLVMYITDFLTERERSHLLAIT